MMLRDRIFQGQDPYSGFSPDPQNLDLQGWGSDNSLFEKLISDIHPRLILEIGTWKGASAIGMANIVKKLGLETEILCIDTWLGNWQHWNRSEGAGSLVDLKLRSGYPSIYYTFLNNVICSGVSNIITPFALPAYSAFKYLENAGIRADMIYIDGDHEYEAVSLDIKTFWSLTADTGVLVGDDYRWPGVKRAVGEIFSGRMSSVHVAGNKFWCFKKDFL